MEDMPFLEDGTPVDIILNPLGVPSRMNLGQILETHLGWAASRLGFRALSPVFDGADEEDICAELARAWIMDRAWRGMNDRMWVWYGQEETDTEAFESDGEAQRMYLCKHLSGLAECEDVDEIVRDPNRARWAWMRQWLAEQGYELRRIWIGSSVQASLAERHDVNEQAVAVCLRLWLKDLGCDSSAVSDECLIAEAHRVAVERKLPLPISGKMIVYDGRTGLPFDRPVTVGVIYMMKLQHMVEDKVHARSTGPYSLVTQQPLGGKAQQGGQRFGEMEVWALEAYGAAHTLQEMLTVKSDDVRSRTQAYEAIVKGERIQRPGVPESFHVLVKEMQGLGLSVEVLNQDGEAIELRRQQVQELPRLGLGLGLPSFGSRWRTR